MLRDPTDVGFVREVRIHRLKPVLHLQHAVVLVLLVLEGLVLLEL